MIRLPEDLNCLTCQNRPAIFDALTPEQLRKISDNRIIVKYKANETVTKQNSPASHTFCVRKGIAKQFIEGPDGKNIILKILKPSDYVGITSILSDSTFRFSVSTIDDSYFCFTDNAIMKELIESNIEFSNRINIALTDMLTRYFDKIIDLTQKQMPGRIAVALLYLYEEIYKDDGFDIFVTRQELSERT